MTTPDPGQTRAFLSVAIEAARRGAAELERWRAKFSVREKSRADLVTDADHASQKVVKFLEALDDHDDVQNVHTDANITPEMAAE